MQGKTEREIVLRHTNQWFTQSEWNVERFAHELLAPALVAAGLIEEALEETDGDAYLKERKAWATRLGRIFNGTSSFPLEWKWTWIGCLPARIADDVRRECVELVGGLDIRVPRISPPLAGPVPADLAGVLQEFGAFVAAATPAHDGSYSLRDDPQAVDLMLREGLDAVLRMVSELMSVAMGTGRSLPDLDRLVRLAKAVAHG
ncbi:hypothetical protein FA541_27905 [Pseudomonas aeruginosa]|uniref:hypothetical protein n=1 Tax=Pseudomonas aeruginosa TaxID=287 RepID=UPI002950560C|nr:hypothetical protein [Pseudomonas aeruginosa]MDV6696902.1 hypothetical protein [Pseudomonas aeruginosa]